MLSFRIKFVQTDRWTTAKQYVPNLWIWGHKNPRGNGQTGRFNRTLLKMIRTYLSGEQRDWDKHLGVIAGAYRATPDEFTTLTPNLMTTGREVDFQPI